ncbi:MAG: pirin family protein [Myxococcales bacterium]|nr:MAG: pirin family protein [Myxococcales bacterium]
MENNNSRQALKTVKHILSPQEEHWVGNGFFVSSILSPFVIDSQDISPFLLLDHAAPKQFSPSTQSRGVGEHPHRGFETVTFAYAGEVEHRDSFGGGGIIGPGDVQWMTAASGLVHEEMHSKEFTRQGGLFEMVQLWVNLPAKLKMISPKYQSLLDKDFPRITLESAIARLIAGELKQQKGPAHTHTPIRVFDLHFEQDGESRFAATPGHTLLALLRTGSVKTKNGEHARERDIFVFDKKSEGDVVFEGSKGSSLLILEGQALDEPVVAHGPFVMNTTDEIRAAIRDFQSGKMGRLS